MQMILAVISATGVTTEFRAIDGKHMQIAQNRLLNETDNKKSFCYSMIGERVALYSIF